MKHNIIIFRTHISIYNYDMGDCPELEKLFSIYDRTYHKRFPKCRIYDETNKVLMIPRGISIGYLERIMGIIPITDTSVDQYEDVGQIKLKYKPRDEDQLQAIKFMLSMDQYRRNEVNTMLSVNLNTGKGKTYCAIAVASYLQYRSIVIADNIGLLSQWKKFFLEYTDIDEKEIYTISGSPSMMKLFNRDISGYKVILSTHSTIKSVGDKLGWDTITNFFKYCKIGVKFYDEAHLNFDNMFQIDCYTNTLITYYLTATPERSNFMENELFKLYFKNVPSINLFNENSDPHTKYAAIKFNSNPSPVDISKCKNAYGLNRMKYTDYLVRSDNFHKLLIILINMALKKPGKHLFYIATNDAILYVRDLIYKDFPELIGSVGIYTSIISPEDKAKELEKKIILSTTKSAGVAMDIKGLAETVNLAEPFKSRVIAQQTLGRTRQKNTVYKDIVDTGFLYTKRFYEFKKPVFNKYASKCIEINMTDDEINKRSNEIIENRSKLQQVMEFYDCNI